MLESVSLAPHSWKIQRNRHAPAGGQKDLVMPGTLVLSLSALPLNN
jgi:hypothetical protein